MANGDYSCDTGFVGVSDPAAFAIIVGENEVQAGAYAVKDLDVYKRQASAMSKCPTTANHKLVSL